MRPPESDEEYVTIIDNHGRERVQRVEYVVADVRGETIYITADGLEYAQDSLQRKGQTHILEIFDRIPGILTHPEIVIQDHLSPDDTLLYYKHVQIPSLSRQQLMCIVIKARQGMRFFYNFFPQQSGKVKGWREAPPPDIWYIASNQNPRMYGLSRS
jgi:hypothetical protein